MGLNCQMVGCVNSRAGLDDECAAHLSWLSKCSSMLAPHHSASTCILHHFITDMPLEQSRNCAVAVPPLLAGAKLKSGWIQLDARHSAQVAVQSDHHCCCLRAASPNDVQSVEALLAGPCMGS